MSDRCPTQDRSRFLPSLGFHSFVDIQERKGEDFLSLANLYYDYLPIGYKVWQFCLKDNSVAIGFLSVVIYLSGERYPGKSRTYVRTPYERCVLLPALLLLLLNCLSSFTRTISRQVHFEERRASRSRMLLCSAPKHCVFAPKPCLHFLPAGLFDAVVWLEKYVLWQGAQKHTHLPPLGWLVGCQTSINLWHAP